MVYAIYSLDSPQVIPRFAGWKSLKGTPPDSAPPGVWNFSSAHLPWLLGTWFGFQYRLGSWAPCGIHSLRDYHCLSHCSSILKVYRVGSSRCVPAWMMLCELVACDRDKKWWWGFFERSGDFLSFFHLIFFSILGWTICQLLTTSLMAANLIRDHLMMKLHWLESELQGTLPMVLTPLYLTCASTWVFPKIMVPPNHPF